LVISGNDFTVTSSIVPFKYLWLLIWVDLICGSVLNLRKNVIE